MSVNIGIVISGAMAKGAYQVGALKAIEEHVPKESIKYISTSSIGTLNGYAFHTHKLDLIEKMWHGICNGKSKEFLTRILKSELLQNYIKELYSDEDDINIPFYSTLFDIKNAAVAYKNLSKTSKDRVHDYLRASIAMPIYNHPVTVGEGCYYDGGIVDNIPIYPLMKFPLDYIICIYFDDVCYKFENSYLDNKIIKISFPTMGNIKQSLVIEQNDIETMINDGYRRTDLILKTVFNKGYDNLNEVYSSIEFLNSQFSSTQLRLTTDAVITNLNKVTQHLTKRRVI